MIFMLFESQNATFY